MIPPLEFGRKTGVIFVYDLEKTPAEAVVRPRKDPPKIVLTPDTKLTFTSLIPDELGRLGDPGDILVIGWRLGEANTDDYFTTQMFCAYIAWDGHLVFWKTGCLRPNDPDYWSPDQNVGLWRDEVAWVLQHLDRRTRRTRAKVIEARTRRQYEAVARLRAQQTRKQLLRWWRRRAARRAKPEEDKAKVQERKRIHLAARLLDPERVRDLTREAARRIQNREFQRIYPNEDHLFIQYMFDVFSHQFSLAGRRVGKLFQVIKEEWHV